MGPYCIFCGHRCFVPRIVPGHSDITILATCQEGAAYDRERLGYDYTTARNPLDTQHIAPYTGAPFTDRCDCCGRWDAHIIHVPTCGWRYCDRCTDHHSFGTESAV